MKYDLSNDVDRIKAQVRLNKLKADGSVIELKKLNPARSLAQNAYIHVLFSLFSIEFGYTLEESKTLLKRACPWMQYEKDGQKFLRHTSKMQTDELSAFTEWVRNYSAQKGLYLMTPEEYQQNQASIDNLIHSHREYL